MEEELDAILKKIRYNEYYSEAKSRLSEYDQQFIETTSWAGELHQKEIDKLVKADLKALIARSNAAYAVERLEELKIDDDKNQPALTQLLTLSDRIQQALATERAKAKER